MSSSGFGYSVFEATSVDMSVVFGGVLIPIYVLLLSFMAIRNPSVVRAIFYPFAGRFNGDWKCTALLVGIWMLASFLVAIWLFSDPGTAPIYQRV